MRCLEWKSNEIATKKENLRGLRDRAIVEGGNESWLSTPCKAGGLVVGWLCPLKGGCAPKPQLSPYGGG